MEGRLGPEEASTLTRLRVEVLRRMGRAHGPGMLQETMVWSCVKDKIGMILTPEGILHDFAILDEVHQKGALGDFLARNAAQLPSPAVAERRAPQVFSFGSQFRPQTGERLLYHLSRHLSPLEAARGRVLAMQVYRQTPNEDWLILSPEDQDRLVPPARLALGQEWEVDPGLTRRLLTHFRPPSHNRYVSTRDVLDGSLRARVVGLHGGKVRVTLTGHVRLEHPDNRPMEGTNVNRRPALGASGWIASARVLGFLEATRDRAGRAALDDLGLVTDGGRWQTPDPSIQLDYGSFIQTAQPPFWGPLFHGREPVELQAPSSQPRSPARTSAPSGSARAGRRVVAWRSSRARPAS